MIGIIDYEAGNIASVVNALRASNIDFMVSASIPQLSRCDGIILPGVGAAQGAMESIERRGLTKFLRENSKPILGICLGMQLFYEISEEGNTECLGILPGTVYKFTSEAVKIPHIGWNTVDSTNGGNLLTSGIVSGSYFYFAHSYYAPVDSHTLAVTECGTKFSSVISDGNRFGVQFHPEKSGAHGMQLLKNFNDLCRSFPR
ncbi:MAG TPA: imidazole glycerol phosphate synthase subunit HisH [Bacteroidota bacterium]|nr:imidazole glycerol phosphate synthase subunit HisH [Bacteroidota bacterium]